METKVTPLAMPSRKPVLRVQCPNPTKACYHDEESALRAMVRIQNLPEDQRTEVYPTRVYRCFISSCGWHLTHRTVEKGEHA